MRRRSFLVPVAALAAVVAAMPASATADGNGWQCINPFASYTNQDFPDDPPAPSHIIDSLAINVDRTVSTPLTAIPGQPLALQDLRLKLDFTDTRPAMDMYRRTGGISTSYRGIPFNQEADTVRTFSVRTSTSQPTRTGWFYNSGTGAAPVWNEVNVITAAGTPPQVRDANVDWKTTWYYASPTVSLAHRYISHTGNSQFALDAWVSISASNTVEGTQTLPVKGYWTVNIKDATPGSPENVANYANDTVTATVPPVSLPLPGSRWTPTGAGPVEFTIAQPGRLGVVQTESKGYERTGYNTPLNVRPFGSVFVRAQTESYAAGNDCIPGAISVANGSITASQTGLFFGDADPVNADPALGDPNTLGSFTNNQGVQKAVGVRGRFAFAFAPLPAIATASLPPVPQVVSSPPKPLAIETASTMKPSKIGFVALGLTNPNSAAVSYKLGAVTVSKYKVGKSRKVVTAVSTRTISLSPGASDVKFVLTPTAQSLLKSRKSLKVTVTLTPVGGGSALTKTLTLKRS